MRFAHIADTHIRNLKYHLEYKEVFEQLYKSLREENVDYIIHCGDIAHTKTQISPEFVDMCREFFANLTAIAPTYVILGNHDGNLKNSSRQDALSPIARAINSERLCLIKNSGEVHLDDKFCLNVLSVFDEEGWMQPTNKGKINIALYHGAIDKSKTDLNWTLGGDHDVSIFEPFDFAFLGDIHKTQRLDPEGRIMYAGSTVQQNFGESLDKGYLLWDIETKKDFSNRLITFKNPKPFITIELTKEGQIPKDASVPEGARLRLVSDSAISLDKMRKSVDVAKHKFKPETLTYLNRSSTHLAGVDGKKVKQKDLRNPKIQEKLIGEYLKEYEISDEVLERVIELNKKYNKEVEDKEDVLRNINWSLESLEWDGLFNYGQGNKIDFDSLAGIVGIFGKNFSGKSSVIDSLLYSLYNSTSKSVRKNLNIINQNMDLGAAKVKIRVDDKLYEVERTSEKYVKKLKGQETLEAKTDVSFSCVDEIGNKEVLNGTSRQDTDKSIRKYFGGLEDFLMTSMASQLDSLTFINEGSTKRKEILAKFLDLEIFDKKFKMAKEDSTDTRGALRRLEGTDFNGKIEEATTALLGKRTLLRENQEECALQQENISTHKEELSLLVEKIESAPTEMINLKKTRADREQTVFDLNELKNSTILYNAEIDQAKDKYQKIINFLSDFDIEKYENKKELIVKSKERLESLLLELKKVSEQKTFLMQKSDLLCKDCSAIITDAANEKDSDMSRLSTEINSIGQDFGELEQDRVLSYVEKFNQLKEKKEQVHKNIETLQLSIDKNESDIFRHNTIIERLDLKLKEYEDNREAIENLEQLVSQKTKLQKSIRILEKICSDCNEQTNNLFREVGSAEQQIKNLEESKKDLEDLRTEFAAYDLLMKCCHPNGISYDIIKNGLPVINDEIAKILTGVVDFEVFIKNEDKKLDIFIKHPKFGPRPLEMGSGAEKTIASMAIRLALLTVSSLPKPDIFILDEPGTALDEDNMEGFIRILDMVKSYFKTVLLISHLDTLKDAVDTQIMIDRKDGYAYINM